MWVWTILPSWAAGVFLLLNHCLYFSPHPSTNSPSNLSWWTFAKAIRGGAGCWIRMDQFKRQFLSGLIILRQAFTLALLLNHSVYVFFSWTNSLGKFIRMHLWQGSSRRSLRSVGAEHSKLNGMSVWANPPLLQPFSPFFTRNIALFFLLNNTPRVSSPVPLCLFFPDSANSLTVWSEYTFTRAM